MRVPELPAGFITGIGIDNDEPQIEIRTADEKIITPLPQYWNIETKELRMCIGYRAPDGKSLVPCPDNLPAPRVQCEGCEERTHMTACVRCKGDRCRNPERRANCIVENNHAVYLVSFAPGVYKVGVARWSRRRDRLCEQGARVGLIIGRTDGLLARRMETIINQFGVPDRRSSYDHLAALATPSDDKLLISELRQLATGLQKRIPYAPWLESHEREEIGFALPNTPHHPDKQLVTGTVGIAGETQWTAGRLVVIKRQDNSFAVLHLGELIGWEIQSLQPGTPVPYQMGLPFGPASC